MKVAGIAIDRWKLPIFKKHLEKAGYSLTEHLGVTPDTMLLKVETESVAALQVVVQEANAEAAKRKHKPIRKLDG